MEWQTHHNKSSLSRYNVEYREISLHRGTACELPRKAREFLITTPHTRTDGMALPHREYRTVSAVLRRIAAARNPLIVVR